MRRNLRSTFATLVAAGLMLAAPLAVSATPLALGGPIAGWFQQAVQWLAPAAGDTTVTKDGSTTLPAPAPVPGCDGCTAGGPDSDPDG